MHVRVEALKERWKTSLCLQSRDDAHASHNNQLGECEYRFLFSACNSTWMPKNGRRVHVWNNRTQQSQGFSRPEASLSLKLFYNYNQCISKDFILSSFDAAETTCDIVWYLNRPLSARLINSWITFGGANSGFKHQQGIIIGRNHEL